MRRNWGGWRVREGGRGVGWEGRLWPCSRVQNLRLMGVCVWICGKRGHRDTKNVHLHTLNAGHWVHVDDPEGLLRLVGPTFGGR